MGEGIALRQATGVLLRAFIGPGRPLAELEGVDSSSEESRLFLDEGNLTVHVGGQGLDLYLSAARIKPSEWLEERGDIRVVLLADLPLDHGDETAASESLERWRGLLLTVNRLQCIPGLHVETEGLDSLSPPSNASFDNSSLTAVRQTDWQEVEALCDETFADLVAALIAADVTVPDLLGEDVTNDGRVIGTMEL